LPDQSLRSRLVVWTLLLEVLILGAGGFFWYREQDLRLHADLDAELQGFAEELSWRLTEQPDADPCAMLGSVSRLRQGAPALGLYAADGALLCSAGAYPAAGSDAKAMPDSAKAPHFTTVSSASQELLRIISVPVAGEGRQYRLEVIRSLQPLEDRLRLLLVRSLAWLAGLLAVSGAAQWLLLKRLLAPLAEVAALARRSGAKHLAERLRLAHPTSEMTELEEAFNDMLDRLEQSVSRTMHFTAIASHELRTPLTILRGEIEIALRRSGLDEEMQALLSSNLEEISRMSRIIEDLLLLSKSDVGEMPLRREALELNELLTDLFGQAAVLGEEKDIAVSFYPSPEQIFFQGDGLRLRQLFLNLLSNAIHYTPGGGSVKMTLQRQGNQVLISVSDSGIGIAPEHLPHIFERFYRVDKVRNQGDGGSGLGLSIAQWVAEAHGGEITAKSLLGKGTEFIVTLPLTGS
jgi:heavy metal sensor kinase